MILVVGQPRTGTTLLMQMLHAAGVPCVGQWPAFEGDFNTPPVDFRVVVYGEALKLVTADVPEVLPRDAKLIVTSRDWLQQARSEWKFTHLLALGKTPPPMPTRRRKAYVDRSRRIQTGILEATKRHSRIVVAFEDAITRPLIVAGLIRGFIGRGDAAAMAAVVKPRSPKCYPGLLEAEELVDGAPPHFPNHMETTE